MGNTQQGAEWRELGELPDASGGPGQPRNIGMGGAFAGVHGGALIVAGGSNFPIPEGADLWSARTLKVFYDRIWIATRGGGANASSSLVWHETRLRLPTPRAYGAVASHPLGLFLLGGTDGMHASTDALLLRWDAGSSRLAMYRLPPMPAPSMEGGAAIIGDILYVVAGSDGKAETADLFAFDLRRIDTAHLDRPTSSGEIALLSRTDGHGGQIDPWTRLASIPADGGHSMARSKMMVAAQSDGHRTRLYVIGGQRTVTQEEYADAVPIGLGSADPHLHFYDDVWAYTPAAAGEAGTWQRKGNVGIGGDRGGRAAGSAIAIGNSQILLLTGGKGDLLRKVYSEMKLGWENYLHPGFERRALVYDARTDIWRAGAFAPVSPDPLLGNRHLVAASAATAQAVCWDGDVVLPSGEVRPRVRSPRIWAVDTSYLGAGCKAGSSQ